MVESLQLSKPFIIIIFVAVVLVWTISAIIRIITSVWMWSWVVIPILTIAAIITDISFLSIIVRIFLIWQSFSRIFVAWSLWIVVVIVRWKWVSWTVFALNFSDYFGLFQFFDKKIYLVLCVLVVVLIYFVDFVYTLQYFFWTKLLL